MARTVSTGRPEAIPNKMPYCFNFETASLFRDVTCFFEFKKVPSKSVAIKVIGFIYYPS